MGLFDIFSNNELKERIVILEKENKKLANNVQNNQIQSIEKVESVRQIQIIV